MPGPDAGKRHLYSSFRAVGYNQAVQHKAFVPQPQFLPGSTAQVCFGNGNTYTRTTAPIRSTIAGEITVERKANDFTFLAAYTFAKGFGRFFRVRRLGEFSQIPS